MMARKVVVLPAPLRPTRQTSWPAATSSEMARRMRLVSMSTTSRSIASSELIARAAAAGACRSPRRSAPGRRRSRPARGRRAPCRLAARRCGVEYSATRSMSCSTSRIALTPARRAASTSVFMIAVLVAARDAAGRLVEQDHLGREREGAGDVEQLLLALREQAGLGIELGVEAEDRGDLAHPRPERRVAAQRAEQAAALRCVCETTATAIVSRHGQRRKDVDQLERARHAALGELDRADAGDVLALEAHDARRSAGAGR